MRRHHTDQPVRPADFFTLQLIEQVNRQPARLHAASFIWSMLITFTNQSEQDMFRSWRPKGYGPAPDNMWVTSVMLGFSNRTGADQLAALLGVNWVRSVEGWPPE
jgi:hypothetical protein